MAKATLFDPIFDTAMRPVRTLRSCAGRTVASARIAASSVTIMKGVYQHCSEKHLNRYATEVGFRHNTRAAREGFAFLGFTLGCGGSPSIA